MYTLKNLKWMRRWRAFSVSTERRNLCLGIFKHAHWVANDLICYTISKNVIMMLTLRIQLVDPHSSAGWVVTKVYYWTSLTSKFNSAPHNRIKLKIYNVHEKSASSSRLIHGGQCCFKIDYIDIGTGLSNCLQMFYVLGYWKKKERNKLAEN